MFRDLTAMLKLTAKTLKATVLLDPAELAGLTVPNGAKSFPISVAVAGRTLTVELNPKTLRRCVATIAETGTDGVAVVLQGKLEGDRLAEAGIVAQIKVPKAAAA
jgi:hypothetical protein